MATPYKPGQARYAHERGLDLGTIIARWQDDRSKLDTHTPILLPLADLWPHREYTWTRTTARSGFATVNGQRQDLSGPVKWDVVLTSMEKGWNPDEPLIFYVGTTGAKVAEGNHRLAIARTLKIKRVPVQFEFIQGKVSKDDDDDDLDVDVNPIALGQRVDPLSPKEKRDISALLRLF